jgi:hypothetical protein
MQAYVKTRFDDKSLQNILRTPANSIEDKLDRILL